MRQKPTTYKLTIFFTVLNFSLKVSFIDLIPSPSTTLTFISGSANQESFITDMSRLIIKNLPSYVTPDRLKEHFSQKNGPGGTLTDVKVAQKPDGTSRRFGFVGFKSEAEAKKAQEYFDKTFIGTTRVHVLVVEVCVYAFIFQ